MMITPDAILFSVLLGIAGWNLLETVKLGKCVERIKQRMDDLPCDNCQKKT